MQSRSGLENLLLTRKQKSAWHAKPVNSYQFTRDFNDGVLNLTGLAPSVWFNPTDLEELRADLEKAREDIQKEIKLFDLVSLVKMNLEIQEEWRSFVNR